MGIWSMNAGLAKIVVVTDDDINIRDPFPGGLGHRISRAARRGHSHHTGRRPITLDPSQPLKDGKNIPSAEQVSSKVGIDATRKHPYTPPSIPPKEHLDKVAANWAHYGIHEVGHEGAAVNSACFASGAARF